MNNNCPKCEQARYQVKDGFTSSGSQRICGARYTPVAKPLGYAAHRREQAIKMYVDGLNFRRIARLLGVHHQTVINWVNAAADHMPEAPPVPPQTDTAELDELYTFEGSKKTTPTS